MFHYLFTKYTLNPSTYHHHLLPYLSSYLPWPRGSKPMAELPGQVAGHHCKGYRFTSLPQSVLFCLKHSAAMVTSQHVVLYFCISTEQQINVCKQALNFANHQYLSVEQESTQNKWYMQTQAHTHISRPEYLVLTTYFK